MCVCADRSRGGSRLVQRVAAAAYDEADEQELVLHRQHKGALGVVVPGRGHRQLARRRGHDDAARHQPGARAARAVAQHLQVTRYRQVTRDSHTSCKVKEG